MLKRKEALRILEKIKWSGKTAKLPQLAKLLKNVLLSPKLDPNIIIDYLLVENAIFKYIYIHHDNKDDFILNDCEIETVEKLRESFNIILNISHPFIEEYLEIDIKCLDIILDYMNKNYQNVISKFENLNINIYELKFDKTSKYTIKIISEVCIYYIITCLKENIHVDDKLLLFCIKKFQELSELFEESYKKRKNTSYHDIFRMHLYQIMSLKLYYAILSKQKVFSLNSIFSGECFTQLKYVCNNVNIDENNNEQINFISLFVIAIDLMILFWSTSVKYILNDDIKSSPISFERRRSQSIVSVVDRIIPIDKQILNSNYISYLAYYMINYLGNKKISNPNFYLKNFDSCINQFLSILIILYCGFYSDTFLSNICYSSMKCAYKNRFIYFTFATSLLSDKNFIISRNTFETFFEFSFDYDYQDTIQNSSKFMLLSIYINQTYEIDRALEFIDIELKNKENISKSYLILFYLAKAICFIHKARSRLFFDQRNNFFNYALENLNYALIIDDYHGEVIFYRAYIYACLGYIDQSINIVKFAIKILYDDPRPIQLYILLLTCQKKYSKALKIVKNSLEKFSTNLNLLYLKIKLTKYVPIDKNYKQQFLDFQDIFKIINRFLNHSRHANLLLGLSKTVPRLFSYESTEIIDFTSETGRNSTGNIKTYSSLKEPRSFQNTISSNCYIDPKSLTFIDDMKLNILFTFWEEADCLSNFTKNIFPVVLNTYPNKPETAYMIEFTRICNENCNNVSPDFLQSLAHNPFHPKLLYLYINTLKKQLINCQNDLESQQILHSIQYYAQIAYQNDPYNLIPLKILGETFYHLGKSSEAADFLSKALDVEKIQPVVSFDTIPLVFCPSDY